MTVGRSRFLLRRDLRGDHQKREITKNGRSLLPSVGCERVTVNVNVCDNVGFVGVKRRYCNANPMQIHTYVGTLAVRASNPFTGLWPAPRAP